MKLEEIGAKQAVENCMKIQSSDKVIIVGDYATEKVMKLLEKACLKKTKYVKLFYLEDYGKRPLKKLPSEILSAAKQSTACFYTAESKPGEKVSIRFPLIEIATKKKGSRQAHMPGINLEIMRTGMATDYKKIKLLSKKVYDLVKNAKTITVTTKKGTWLIAKFSKKIKWIICDGDITKSPIRWSNLPDGEVFTCPKEINGFVTVDGVLGDWLGPEYGFMEKQPLKLIIKNGRIIKTDCKNKKLLDDFNNYIKQDKNANRIGEFAIGTNIGLKKFVGNLLQDEKFPGLHIATGDSYSAYTKSGWKSKAHCDMVIKKVNIFVDNKQIMKEGKFLI